MYCNIKMYKIEDRTLQAEECQKSLNSSLFSTEVEISNIIVSLWIQPWTIYVTRNAVIHVLLHRTCRFFISSVTFFEGISSSIISRQIHRRAQTCFCFYLENHHLPWVSGFYFNKHFQLMSKQVPREGISCDQLCTSKKMILQGEKVNEITSMSNAQKLDTDRRNLDICCRWEHAQKRFQRG